MFNTIFCTYFSNDDDLDDEDTNEESSLKSRNRDASEVNSEGAEPSPGPSASSETQPPDGDGEDGLDDKPTWPTITDLNTRLRRVITSYQRSYRKEEQKLSKSKVSLCFLWLFLKILVSKNIESMKCLFQSQDLICFIQFFFIKCASALV